MIAASNLINDRRKFLLLLYTLCRHLVFVIGVSTHLDLSVWNLFHKRQLSDTHLDGGQQIQWNSF